MERKDDKLQVHAFRLRYQARQNLRQLTVERDCTMSEVVNDVLEKAVAQKPRVRVVP